MKTPKRFPAAAWVFPGMLAVLAWQGRPMEAGLYDNTQDLRPVMERQGLGQDELDTIELFEQASPAVVHIRTTEVLRDRFSFAVREEFTGTGSGFFWDPRGYIVTNYHVIKGARRAFVTLSDGSEHEAELVGAEPNKDIAVLRIQAEGAVAVLPVGKSEDLKVGQSVYAIGNPFGLDHTLTTGIISGLDREIIGIAGNRLRDLIQTDAAINPGNSGGPLLDSAGRLIGMNTAIKSLSGASAGIGFAVPVDTMNRIVTTLIRGGEIPHASLGVAVLSSRWSRARGIPGLVLGEIEADGPAAAAGLQAARQTDDGRLHLGDLLLAIDQDRLRSGDDLARVLAGYEPGESVVLTILRENQEQQIRLELGSDR